MNREQEIYLRQRVEAEFARQGGYRGGIKAEAQVYSATVNAGKAIARKLGTIDYCVAKAVTAMRTGHLQGVTPATRTVALCTCGKPKAPHSPALHGGA